MRLESVTLRSYRIHAETTVAFDPSRTVIGGPNEAGKSTIVEAVHRALFLRARTSGALLDAMRSSVHPGPPAVDLRFEAEGRRYTLVKQFTGTNSAPTTLVEEGGATLRNEQAEERLRDLLDAEMVAGQGGERRLRMQWAHLWVWQGVAGHDPLEGEPMERPLERLSRRLGGLQEGDVLESPFDAAVGAAVAGIQAARTKAGGAPRTDSPLGVAESALAAARAAAAGARDALDALADAVDEAERSGRTIAESDASLAARRREQEDTGRLLEEVGRLEILRAHEEAAAKVASGRLGALEDADRQILASDETILRIEDRRAPAVERHAAAVLAEQEAERRLAAARREVDRRRAEHDDVAAIVEIHRRAEHLERRRTEREGLAGRCARIAEIRARLSGLESRLAALPVVEAADLAALSELERKRDAARTRVDAIAARVELLAADAPVTLGGVPLGPGGSETIGADTDLVVGGTRLRIAPGGGTSLAEARRLLDEAVASLEARIRAAGIADVDEARRVQPQRQSVASQLDAAREAIEGLGGASADADLIRLDDEIAALDSALARSAPPGFARPAGLGEAIAARVAVEGRLESLVRESSTAAAEVQAAERIRADAVDERECTAAQVRHVEDELRTATARRDVLVSEHGTDRAGAIAAARLARDEADAALAGTVAALSRLQPDVLRQRAAMLARAVEKLTEARQAAQAARTVALARLRTEGTVDPHDDLARARAAERAAEAAVAHAAREARAHALLARLFAEKKREIEARFVAPLVVRVADYLRPVFGPDVQVAVDHADGRFRSLVVARPGAGAPPVPFAALSGGTREQVAAAFRLAMAEILAPDHGGCLPVVFDDAFVNSDPGRTGAVQSMLDLAANRGLQVIVLSCNHRDYDPLGAAVVELLSPGQRASRPPGAGSPGGA